MKKLWVLGLCLSAAIWAGGKSAGKGTAEEKKAYRVVFVARAQVDSFAVWLNNSLKEEATKYADVQLTIFDSQASDEKENSLIENAIINKPDLMIIQPNNGESQRPYVEKAVAAGILVMTANPRMSGIAGTSSVDADPYAQGAVQAQAALKQVPQNAKVVVLNGPPGNIHSTARRESWQKEFFARRPDVKIVGEQIANWNKDEALNLMEDWIQANDRIDAIISMNDNMAAGALEITKGNAKFAKTLAYGVDGTAEALMLIKEGRMTSTTMQNAYTLAEKIMSVAHQLLTGKAKQIDLDIDNPNVNRDNVEQYLEIHRKAGNL